MKLSFRSSVITILLVSLAVMGSEKSYAQQSQKDVILNKFITMHNDGSEASIKEFIKATYHPGIYSKIDLKKHVAFYNHVIGEFGTLNAGVYEKARETPTKLVVHLIKSDRLLSEEHIDPTEVLVVEIDLHETEPTYLSRGLGLGALACARE